MRQIRVSLQLGVTLLELLVSIAVIGVLAAIAIPYYGDYIERQRWVGAAEAVYSQMSQAKRLAISNNSTIYFIATSDSDPSNWCLTYSEDSSSGCNAGWVVNSAANPALPISGENYPNISLDTNGFWPLSIGFVMPGLGVSSAQSIGVVSSRLGTITVSASAAMNVNICSDDYVRFDCN